MSASLELDECLKDNVICLFMKPRFDKGSARQKAADAKLKLEMFVHIIHRKAIPFSAQIITAGTRDISKRSFIGIIPIVPSLREIKPVMVYGNLKPLYKFY